MAQLSISGKGMHWRFEKLVGSRSIMPFYHTLDLVLCTNARCSSVRTLGSGDGTMAGGRCRMAADRPSACVYPLA
jgi:hypothetical protein